MSKIIAAERAATPLAGGADAMVVFKTSLWDQ
jgi:hypothetical protein